MEEQPFNTGDSCWLVWFPSLKLCVPQLWIIVWYYFLCWFSLAVFILYAESLPFLRIREFNEMIAAVNYANLMLPPLGASLHILVSSSLQAGSATALKFWWNSSCQFYVMLRDVSWVSVSLKRARNPGANSVVMMMGPGWCMVEMSGIRPALRFSVCSDYMIMALLYVEKLSSPPTF